MEYYFFEMELQTFINHAWMACLIDDTSKLYCETVLNSMHIAYISNIFTIVDRMNCASAQHDIAIECVYRKNDTCFKMVEHILNVYREKFREII